MILILKGRLINHLVLDPCALPRGSGAPQRPACSGPAHRRRGRAPLHLATKSMPAPLPLGRWVPGAAPAKPWSQKTPAAPTSLRRRVSAPGHSDTPADPAAPASSPRCATHHRSSLTPRLRQLGVAHPRTSAPRRQTLPPRPNATARPCAARRQPRMPSATIRRLQCTPIAATSDAISPPTRAALAPPCRTAPHQPCTARRLAPRPPSATATHRRAPAAAPTRSGRASMSRTTCTARRRGATPPLAGPTLFCILVQRAWGSRRRWSRPTSPGGQATPAAGRRRPTKWPHLNAR